MRDAFDKVLAYQPAMRQGTFAPNVQHPLLDAYASDPRVTKYMDWRTVQHVSEIAERLATFVRNTTDGKCPGWVIRKLDETAPCGRIDLRIRCEEAGAGYVVAVSKWDQAS
jgi:hypothetical protein